MDSIYYYDSNNRLILYERGSADDDYYDDYRRVDLTYDSNGRLETWMIFDPGRGYPHGKCEYNKKGQLIASVGEFFNISYTYDAQGYLVQAHGLPAGDVITYPEEILTFVYDDQSRVSRIIYKTSYHGGLTSEGEYHYNYEHYPFVVESSIIDGTVSYCHVYYDCGLINLPMGILGLTNNISSYISSICGYSHFFPTMTYENGMLEFIATSEGLYDFDYNSDHSTSQTSTKSDDSNDISAYVEVVKKAIEDNRAFYTYIQGRGSLCDIDGNGVEELLMCYYTKLDEDSEFDTSAAAYSVYTLSEGKVVPLFERECLYYDAGGPWGYVGVVKKDGETYLATTSENGSVWGSGEECSGNWRLYKLDDISLTQNTSLEYTCVRENSAIVPSKSFVTINGEKFDYSTYEKWEEEIEEVLVVYPFDDGWSPQHGETMTLQELLEHIEENKTK